MSGLGYFLGPPLIEFPDNRLPTLKDVLRFYANFWGQQANDSTKETLVAQEIIKVYRRRNMPIVN